MMRDQMLALIDVAKVRGLEIGPLHKPIVTREMGPVEYIDRGSREELQRWYAVNDSVDLEAIVHVDHIWGDQSLLECVGGREYGYLIASHVIEHVPDLFGWLREIAAVLAPGGLAAFAVPDKRYTFDILRRTSGAGELVDAYVRGLRKPEPRQIFDHFYNFRDLGAPTIPAGTDPRDLPVHHTPTEALAICQQMQTTGLYIDTHCWVFTPRSMVEALDLGNRLGLLPYEIAALEPQPESLHEFLLVLRRQSDSLDAPTQRAAFLASLEQVSLPEEAVSEHDVRALRETAQIAAERVAAIEASTSWKLTAPLRAAVGLARKLGGRG